MLTTRVMSASVNYTRVSVYYMLSFHLDIAVPFHFHSVWSLFTSCLSFTFFYICVCFVLFLGCFFLCVCFDWISFFFSFFVAHLFLFCFRSSRRQFGCSIIWQCWNVPLFIYLILIWFSFVVVSSRPSFRCDRNCKMCLVDSPAAWRMLSDYHPRYWLVRKTMLKCSLDSIDVYWMTA